MSEKNSGNNINVDEIINQIRKEIKEKGLDSSMLSFEDIPFDKEVSKADTNFQLSSLMQSTEYLNIRNQIEPYKNIDGNPITVFIKKVLRKLMKFYIMPIMTEQNALNHHSANALNQLSCYVQKYDGIDISELAGKLKELELKQEANRLEIESLRSQVSALSAENSMLRKNS